MTWDLFVVVINHKGWKGKKSFIFEDSTYQQFSTIMLAFSSMPNSPQQNLNITKMVCVYCIKPIYFSVFF